MTRPTRHEHLYNGREITPSHSSTSMFGRPLGETIKNGGQELQDSAEQPARWRAHSGRRAAKDSHPS